MEKLDRATDGSSMDIVQDNIAKLKQLFPDVFSEGKIDFEKLQETLGDVLEDKEERYNFTWHGKSQAKRIAQTVSTGTLLPCKEESKNWDTTQNLFIEGDNLEVLKLLQKSYHNQVKMIYIDPPYNTGKEFIYPDNYRDNLDTYMQYTGQKDNEGRKFGTNADTSGRYHTNWLNMMYPRLKLARNLMRDDGVIFISIDDNEVANLRKLCDEIFGEENLLAELIWHLSSGPQAGHFTRSNETIIAFAKNKDNLSYFSDTTGGTIKHGALKKISKANPASEITFKLGSIKFEGKDAEFEGELGGSEKQYIVSGKLRFENGLLSEDVTIKAGWAMKNQVLSWLEGKETFDSKGQKVIRFFFNSQGILFYEKERGTFHPKTVLSSVDVGGTKAGSDEIIKIFGAKIMDFPKPASLIRFLSKTVTFGDDIIFDFFSGSGTTAHAIMDLNAQDNGNRKHIMVQLPEPCDKKSEAYKAGYKTIADIGKERIRRAGEKILQDNADKEGIGTGKSSCISSTSTIHGGRNLDIGFKVFKLDSSNIKPWDADFDNLEGTLLAHVDNIKADRSEDDVLYEILLKYGLNLTVPIEERSIHGKTVYIIGFGALIVCLDNAITLDVVDGIGALKEELEPEVMRVVFKDSGFKDDVVKTNAIQNLKRFGIDDVKSL